MKRYFVKSIFIVLSSLFFSCEYETEKDHFIEKEKPSENIDLKLNIRNIGKDGIINIYTITELVYSIDVPNQQLLNITFTLDGRIIPTNNNAIILYPISDQEEEQDLKVKVELKSNTGSLAEKLYMEKYVGEFSFKVRFIQGDLNLNITQESTNEGYLKLIWDKPSLEQTPVAKYNISYYDIISGQEKSFDIDNPDDSFFIDSDYVYGFREYKVMTYFESSKIKPWTDIHIVQYKEFTIEDLQLDLRQQLSSDGYFELIWDKPNLNRMPVIKYLIEYYDSHLGGWQTKNIEDLNKTSFADENYAYGEREFRFTVWLHNELFSFTTKYTPVYKGFSKDDFVFEDIDLETIRISWPQPEFNCTQIVRLFDDKNILIADGMNSIDVERLPFPGISWRWSNYNMISVNLVGKRTDYELTSHPDFYTQGSFGTNYFHDQFQISDPLGFAPYPKGNLLYTLARRGIYKTDMETMTLTKLIDFDESIDVSMACDQYSSKVAVSYDGRKINIYRDHGFANPVEFELAYELYNPRAGGVMKFIPDDKLLLLVFVSGNWLMNNNMILSVFDANTSNHLYDIPIPSAGRVVGEVKTSDDGKYLFVTSFKYNDDFSLQVDIYELNGNQTNLIKTLSYDDLMTHGSFIYFNSSNPTQLIQGNNNKFRVSELPSFNKIAEIDGQFSSIDVVNGNFLYTTSGQLHQKINVTDPTLSKLLFQMSIDSEDPLSYNNVLVSPSIHAWGSYFDISKFMKKTK